MLQADSPDSFILATSRTTTVRDFVKMAFSAVDIDIEFRGEGEDELDRYKRWKNLSRGKP